QSIVICILHTKPPSGGILTEVPASQPRRAVRLCLTATSQIQTIRSESSQLACRIAVKKPVYVKP
ncbi:MAG TPA: hypothetical protein VF797_18695, partial [Noviherbaspirillum sp.]